MKLIIGGSIAIVFSLLGFAYFFPEFIKLLAGCVPVMLLAGGGLALYLYREMHCDACDEPIAAEDGMQTKTSPCAKKEGVSQTRPRKPLPSVPSPEKGARKSEPEQASARESEPAKEQTPKKEIQPEDRAPVEETVADKKREDAKPRQTAFIGNTQSKVFHAKGCKYSMSKKCTQPFATGSDAAAAGYKACGVCRPVE